MNFESQDHASVVYEYINIKTKMIKVLQNINFNKKCTKLRIIPKYAKIKLKNNTVISIKIGRMAETLWLKEEIKHLYATKNTINKKLYECHLKLLNAIPVCMAEPILDIVHRKTANTAQKILHTHEKKIQKLLKD